MIPILASAVVGTLSALGATETWRLRVCHIHWQLLQRNPYSPPKPLHAALNLDATREPFYPQSLSSTPSDMLHRRVIKALLTATAKEAGRDLKWVASHLRAHDAESFNPGQEMEDEKQWMFLLIEICSMLINDDIRGHYAQWFVPKLTQEKMFKGEEALRKARIQALEDLCA